MTGIQPHAVAADTVFDGSVARRHSAVVIERGRIRWVGRRDELPKHVAVHDLPSGYWLAPGFIDLQVNGGGDVFFNDDPTPAGIARMVAAHRRFGTTGLLPTLISDTYGKMVAAFKAVQEMPAGSGVLGIHFEGPFLSREKSGAHAAARLGHPTGADARLLASPRNGAIVVTLAPEEVPEGFIAELVLAGVRVSCGHTMATYIQTKKALAEGLTGFTHLFNAMRPMESREPGPIAAALEAPNAWFGAIVDGVHVAPAMLRLALRGAARPMLVTDAMPPVGGTRPVFLLHGEAVEAQGAACRKQDGTLAGSALDMASAVRNCVRLLDVPLTSALRYASAEPALFLGIGDRLGALAAGFQADMVAFEPESMRVIATWVAGSCVAGP
jgi:N-acetylglucosamine-6-phosphate deacetylase